VDVLYQLSIAFVVEGF